MKNILYFGEKHPDYSVPVLNEREVRAAAGILFAFALVAFMNVMLVGNFFLIKVFIILFFIDFFIRLLVNPKYAPSMILGRLAVNDQKPEYVGAPQKKFAWSIGLALATFMLITTVFGLASGLTTCWVCIICLLFLFFESVFGICVGCKLYNIFNKEKAQLCPGGVCEIVKKEDIQKISLAQVIIAFIFILFALYLFIFRPSVLQSQVITCGTSNNSYSPCASYNNNAGSLPCGANNNVAPINPANVASPCLFK